MGLFADLIPKETPIPQEAPPIADPNDIGIFSDLINPQEKIQQQSWFDKRLEIFGKSMTAVKHGGTQAALGIIDNLLGTEQWIGEAVEKYGPKVTKKWAKNLAESSKAVASEFDTYQREHPEEAIQISPDAGFWKATKEVMTSPANITKGLIQALPLLLEAYIGGAAIKTATYTPRTAATIQKWGSIAGMSAGTFGTNYKDIRKRNISPEAATAQAFLTSLGESIIEEWTLSKKIGLFKSAKAAILKKNMGRVASTILIGGSKAYVRGGAEEATQQLNSNFWNLIFTDRSQDLMKGVSQSAGIGAPMEMAMSGVFAGAGLVTRQIGKVDQLNRLDKMDDFIANTDLSPEEKGEAHQVIENKRQEIEQTSILPTEEIEQSETSIAGKILYHGTTAIKAAKIQTEGFKPKIINGQYYGSGVYLTPNKIDAAQFGETIIETTVDLKNPFVLNLDNYRSIEEWYDEIQDNIEYPLKNEYGEAITVHSTNPDTFKGKLARDATEASEAITGYFEDKGNDGVIVRQDGKVVEVVVFNPKNIKTEPVTEQPTVTVKDENTLDDITQKILREQFPIPSHSAKSEAVYFDNGEIRIRVAKHPVVYAESDVDVVIGIGKNAGPDSDLIFESDKESETTIRQQITTAIEKATLRHRIQEAIDNDETLDNKTKLLAQKYPNIIAEYSTLIKQITTKPPITVKDETITPESLPEIHPDEEIAEVKAQNSVDTTIDKLVNLIEAYKEPLEELSKERSKELAKRWGEFEKIYMSGKEPEVLYKAMKTLEGELPHIKYRAVETEFSPEQLQEMIWAIRTAPKLPKVWDRKNAETGLIKVLKGEEVTPSEVRLLQEVFGEKLTKAFRKRGDFALSWYQRVADVTNMPIALLTSCDLSHLLRQGFFLGLVAPGAWKESAKTGYSILFAKDFKKIAERVDLAIKTNEYYDFIKDKMGVEFTDWRSVTIEGLETKEEPYQSEIAHLIPGISRSEAAYCLGSNKIRLDTAIEFINQWKGEIRTDYDWKALGTFINLATGRGDVKGLKTILPMLNGAFFAPRLFASRFQLPIHLIRTMIKSPPVFKIMAGGLVKFVGLGALVLYMASMIPGVDVDKDPESSDFGKIKYGDTHVDFWQGYAQIARTTVQLMTGYRKSTVTGRRLTTERTDIALKYLQSKLSPVAGATWELFSGKKFDGTPVEYTAAELGKTVLQKTIPLFLQDVADAWYYQGMGTALMIAPAAFHGLGVQTYPVRPEQKATLVKQELARQYFGKNWDEIGPLAQKLLRENEPRIEESEVIARQQREGYPYLDEIIKEQKQSEKKVYRKLPENVQDELDSTFSEIGGLSRRIGNGWFLNDNKYNEYTNNVSKYLNKVLPLIVNAPKYKLLTNEQKKMILERAIAEVKNAERKRLVNEGKREDVQTLLERTRGK